MEVSDSVQAAAMRISCLRGLRFMLVRRKARAGVTSFVYSIEKYVGLRQVVRLKTKQTIRLLRVQAGIETPLVQQLPVCALFDQTALV